MKSNDERARKCNGAIEALEELFPNSSGKASIYHRYVLVQRASGELVFEQEEFDFYLEQAIAEAFGQRTRRKRIRIAMKS
jgi:hypothetical protein